METNKAEHLSGAEALGLTPATAARYKNLSKQITNYLPTPLANSIKF
ncbi:hypothetical protein ACE1CI_27695 [Aerosakkonemataceae cyanobacterium BLCC-F50]|uniref:Uncharacterized protein n=1 Tax=Floridaenema flaviceps BLCC-F50 TaxID=3153642 RepID=A0ABV4XZ18_9CYAN